VGIKRVAGLALNRLLMRVDNRTGKKKGTSGMDKFSSKVHRVHMEFGGKLLSSLRIMIQFLERLESVSVVDGAAHTQKNDVESNGGSLEYSKVLHLLSRRVMVPASARCEPYPIRSPRKTAQGK
jgi:hypothetical protein